MSTVYSFERSGARFVYSLQEGEDCAFVEGVGIVVVHPERQPKVIRADGSEEILRPSRGA